MMNKAWGLEVGGWRRTRASAAGAHRSSLQAPHFKLAASQRGFTLLEMIVAVGIFSIVMLLATGAYLTLINLNRQVQGVNTVVTNLSFVLEDMARNIRTGSQYCVGGCSTSRFTYRNTQGQTVEYTLDNAGAVTRTIGAATEELTDPAHMTVSSLRFYPVGYAKGDGIQPHVTIVLIGTAKVQNGNPVTFDIQTTATERLIDL
ncbi:MAG: prepilin-type N-terminal cleavage/methylation domain-containing protein [Patescibacteria group bacterium]|nr:prepilin-type N-terminal cleavage/methylation domain-containing protein [Patescibacteria group bacterium]